MLLVNFVWEEEQDSAYLTRDCQLETNRDADSKHSEAIVILGLERIFSQVRCLSNFSRFSELKILWFFRTNFNILIQIKAQM
jgi:hypothetical protein